MKAALPLLLLHSIAALAADPAECDLFSLTSNSENQTFFFGDFRSALLTFFHTNNYQKSVSPQLDVIPLFIGRNYEETFETCPSATLTCLLLLTEHSLERLYVDSTTTGSLAQLREAQRYWEAYVRLLRRVPADKALDPLWPIAAGEQRVRRLFAEIESMGKRNINSPIVLSLAVNGSKSVDDEFWKVGFNEVVDELEKIPNIDFFPYGGALIAFLRYGGRTGNLTEGKEDVVEKDMDMFVGVDSPSAWSNIVAPALSRALIKDRGWDDCFMKSSVPYDTEFTLFARKDLLQCVKVSARGIPLLADIVSFVRNKDEQSAYFQDIRSPQNHRYGAWFLGQSASDKQVSGADWSTIYPLGVCKAWNRAIPCPHKPVEFLEIFNEMFGFCIALPKVFNRDMDDPRNQHLAAKGLNSADIQLIRNTAESLNAEGFKNLLVNFATCEYRDKSAAFVDRATCPGGACGAKLQVFSFELSD